MIGNAHLDPIWLWEYAEGIDTVLATARSACDRLDEYPQFVFTCAGSWFYRQVEQCDPALFERVRKHVASGRWAPVGGMVVQPDCNLQTAESFAKQFEHGNGYYREKFGLTSKVGYNVDSFGHVAYLPRFLRESGLEHYVFMRPGHHEKKMPGDLFVWRSPDGAEVTAFHIPMAYCDGLADLAGAINCAKGGLPKGIEHTMCFYGVGDHGGGPTKAMIEKILANQDAFEGVKLVFSHPQAFFDAIAGQTKLLPVVQDELQIHAVGCYAVERRIKSPMRRAEYKLLQAERTIAKFPQHAPADAAKHLNCQWEKVLFNQFHDVFCGTSIDVASRRAAGQLEAACAAGEDIVTLTTRRGDRCLAEPGVHKIVVFNPSDVTFDGLISHVPLPADAQLLDEQDKPVPFQAVDHRSLLTTGSLFAVKVPPDEYRVLHVGAPKKDDVSILVPNVTAPTQAQGTFTVEANKLANGLVNVEAAPKALKVGDWEVGFEVRRDTTDTWSHSVDRFSGKKIGRFNFAAGWKPKELGPIRASLLGLGTFGNSRIWAQIQQVQGLPLVRLRLALVWSQVQQLLQLRLAAPAQVTKHVCLVSGGPLDRKPDSVERPLNGGLILETKSVLAADGTSACSRLGVVCPDIFSLSTDRKGTSLTLVRSPYICHHDPNPTPRPDQPLTDQGQHYFDIDLYPNFDGDAAKLANLARQADMPPFVWDLTG
jgi:alpha-mannosidase